MASRSPYLFVETKKQWPYWSLLIWKRFSRHVTAAMLVYSNKEAVAILDVINIK